MQKNTTVTLISKDNARIRVNSSVMGYVLTDTDSTSIRTTITTTNLDYLHRILTEKQLSALTVKDCLSLLTEVCVYFHPTIFRDTVVYHTLCTAQEFVTTLTIATLESILVLYPLKELDIRYIDRYLELYNQSNTVDDTITYNSVMLLLQHVSVLNYDNRILRAIVCGFDYANRHPNTHGLDRLLSKLERCCVEKLDDQDTGVLLSIHASNVSIGMALLSCVRFVYLRSGLYSNGQSYTTLTEDKSNVEATKKRKALFDDPICEYNRCGVTASYLVCGEKRCQQHRYVDREDSSYLKLCKCRGAFVATEHTETGYRCCKCRYKK
jgi:hypothetical protein